MRKRPWIAIALVGLAGCNYTEGMCHPREQGAGNAGSGGGVIVPGTGGFGDVPPDPQGAADPMPPDCNMVPNTPCHQKCLDEYEDRAVKCAKIQGEAERKTCDEGAYGIYTNCRESCQKKEGDCLEACKEQCDRAWERCRDDCPKGDKGCLNDCSQEYGKCLKECDNRCK